MKSTLKKMRPFVSNNGWNMPPLRKEVCFFFSLHSFSFLVFVFVALHRLFLSLFGPMEREQSTHTYTQSSTLHTYMITDCSFLLFYVVSVHGIINYLTEHIPILLGRTLFIRFVFSPTWNKFKYFPQSTVDIPFSVQREWKRMKGRNKSGKTVLNMQCDKMTERQYSFDAFPHDGTIVSMKLRIYVYFFFSSVPLHLAFSFYAMETFCTWVWRAYANTRMCVGIFFARFNWNIRFSITATFARE